MEVKQAVDDFFTQFPLRRYEKGTIIVRPHEKVEEVFYLLEGQIVAYDISSSGSEVVVNAFKPGAFFPLSIALNHTPNPYFYEAVEATVARPAPSSEVVDFLRAHPEVTLDVLKRVYRGTDGVLRRMAHLMGGTARTRLLYELLNAAYRFGKRQLENEVLVPLSETDLGKRAGLSRETVSRELKKLKASELVAVTSAGIIIRSVARLEELLGSDI